jgi:hypothetical protein
MAAPNLVSPTTITADRDVWAATNTNTTRVTCGASESIVVVAIIATNIHASNVGWASAEVNNGSAFRVAYQVSIPLNASVNLLDKPLVLNPSDLLKLQANASSNVETVVSMMRFA